MNKPEFYELKKWLRDNTICGLKVHYYQTGDDTADTDWELIPDTGKSRKVKADIISRYVEVRPDWVSVLRPLSAVIQQVNEYEAFAKKESRDLAEYERLKKKFG